MDIIIVISGIVYLVDLRRPENEIYLVSKSRASFFFCVIISFHLSFIFSAFFHRFSLFFIFFFFFISFANFLGDPIEASCKNCNMYS